jgi:hypothetical protein
MSAQNLNGMVNGKHATITCKTCKFWDSYDWGKGFCRAINERGVRFLLPDGGSLETAYDFGCAEWQKMSQGDEVVTE